ncbi:DUF2777 family protein [Schinkia sp. CFF1]
MNLHRKLAVIPFQERAYIEGTIERIGDDWIFFDEINHEAFELNDLGDEFEVQLNGIWKKGTLIEDTILLINHDFHYLTNGDYIRYKKNLTYSFKKLIEELSEESYLHFVKTLNSLSYSLYDCVFCNNFLSFLELREQKEGMNVIIFDNEEQICVVQHYFYRDGTNAKTFKDRFEFAQNDGNRTVCTFLS